MENITQEIPQQQPTQSATPQQQVSSNWLRTLSIGLGIIGIGIIIGIGGYLLGQRRTNTVPTIITQPSPTPTPKPSSTPKLYHTPTSTLNPNGEKIIRKVSELESHFLIQKINPDSVDGIQNYNYGMPLKPTQMTFHIGDDVGYSCEDISDKLTSIDFSSQRVTFTKTVGSKPLGGCPICLAGNTMIDTPSGPVAVIDLQVGMSIWTTDKAGHRISGVISKTSRVPVSPTHQMVHVVLVDHREISASKGHPTSDGRTIDMLTKGDILDGSIVVKTELTAYSFGYTYDLLPASDTGYYYANGVLMGSTLK